MRPFKNIFATVCRVATAGLLLCLLLSGTVFAGAYGRDGYSKCNYSTGCPPSSSSSAPPSTVVTTPSGFDFAVNLTEGQVITVNEYTVMVTALHGSDAQFTKVEFYLDGVLAHTTPADGSGTFTWPWDTRDQPAKQVKIIVYEVSGGTASKTFNITIRLPSQGGTTTPKPTSEKPLSFFGRLLEQIRRFIRALPPIVIYGFPYLLFLLLGLGILLLFLQVLREAREVKEIEDQLKRDQALNAQKETFVALASHYLRTPLTVMRGAAELGVGTLAKPPDSWSLVAHETALLEQKIEEILSRVAGTKAPAVIVMEEKPEVMRIWRSFGFVAPCLLIGAIAFGADMLVALVGQVDISFFILMTQVVAFGLTVLLLYVTLRARRLQQRRRERATAAREKEVRIDASRNELIKESVDTLYAPLLAIQKQLPRLEVGHTTTLLKDGADHFNEVLNRFNLARQLTVGGVLEATKPIALSALLEHTLARYQPKAQAKHVTIIYPHDTPVLCRQPNLLAFVMNTLVDNAIAFSPEGSPVTIEATNANISVTDRGPGIPEDKLGALFHPFTSTGDIFTFSHEGMGFSLYLDKMIMTYLHGDIVITASPGQGTKVTLLLQT